MLLDENMDGIESIVPDENKLIVYTEKETYCIEVKVRNE
jgi:hypothetical protein